MEHGGSSARWGAASLVALLALALPHGALAQAGDVAAAADAYGRAQEAELRGDWESAAQLYALADRIAPTLEALRSAAVAAERAGLAATATTHAEALLARHGDDAGSRRIADEIMRAHRAELGRVRARCAPECRVLLDGRVVIDRAATEHVFYARPGRRRIAAAFESGDQSEEVAATLDAGETTELTLSPPPPVAGAADVSETPATAGGGGGISPGFFVAGAVLTGVGAALSIWSGVEVLDAHSTYDPSADDAQLRFAQGRDLETRTNVLLGVTGGLAVATIVLALLTDWDGDPPAGAANDRGRFWLAGDPSGVLVGWSRVIP